MAQGLLPGTALHLATSAKAEEREELVTRIEAVDDERLSVLVPARHSVATPIEAGTVVRASYTHRQRRYGFMTEATGQAPDGRLQFLRAPAVIEPFEQRGTYRLQTSIRPLSLYRLIIDMERLGEDGAADIDGLIVDLGEGGLCFSTAGRVRMGERLGVHASLGEPGEFMARMRAVTIEEPPPGQQKTRVRCQFTDISRPDADRIARYLMHRQIELRRRGQL